MKEAEKALQAYVPAVKQFTGSAINLDRMQAVMQALGNPESKLRIVHVAGTSGKTSTSYYVASLLQHSGYKTGLTVSPHIDIVTERIQIQGVPLPSDVFCSYLTECIARIADLPVQPSYFELLMALAYYVFYKEGVEWAVIETGMGGLLDASNVAIRPDKLCVITDIGYDHMHILGNTLTEIAAQKAGIIHQNNSVFMYKQSHEIMTSIRARIEAKQASLYLFDDAMVSLEADMPAYQQRNWQLAYETVCAAIGAVPPEAITASKATYIPGRMDIVEVARKTVIMDGAHNAQKMQAFVASFKKQYTNKKVTVVLAMKEGKEYKEVIDCLLPLTRVLYVTSFSTSQDLPAHALRPDIIAAYAEQRAVQNIFVEPDAERAFHAALQGSDDVVVVTGSFYLLAQLRQLVHLQHAY